MDNYKLLVADQLMSFCIIAPLVVFYWRGTWQLWDVYVYPENPTLSGWICFAVGNIGVTAMAFLKGACSKLATNKKCSLKWLVGCHIYIYICGFCCVAHWRGTWLLLDEYTGVTIISNITTFLIGIGLLFLLRANKNCWAPPGACLVDTDPSVFNYNTRFGTKPQDLEKYILDTLLTTFVIHNLVVFFWRGSWELMDLLLFPSDLSKSAHSSLAIAAVIFLILVPVQIILLKAQKSFWNKLCAGVAMDDIVFTLANLCSVFHWRGVWVVCNLYVLPGNVVVSNWVTHAVGALGSALLLCSASYVVKSYEADGSSLLAHTSQLLPNRYIRYLANEETQRSKDLITMPRTANRKYSHCNNEDTHEPEWL